MALCSLAPECSGNRYTRTSDVFSFGLIDYELLTGQPGFDQDLTRFQMTHKVVVDEKRRKIPEFGVPAAQKPITNCRATEPEDRPSFQEIVERSVECELSKTLSVCQKQFCNICGMM
jgi:serine/threonine protein kinase